jgi:hypothetical protein
MPKRPSGNKCQWVVKTRASDAITNDKDPLPPFQAARIFHRLVYRGHHETGKHATDLTNSCEDRCSFGDFRSFTYKYVS